MNQLVGQREEGRKAAKRGLEGESGGKSKEGKQLTSPPPSQTI